MFVTPPQPKRASLANETGEPAPQTKRVITQFNMATAKKFLQDAKNQLDMSGNIKTSIKDTVLKSLRGLYDIVQRQTALLQEMEQQKTAAPPTNQIDLVKELEKQHQMAEETHKKLENIQTQITEINKTQQDIHKLANENRTFTYAEALSGKSPSAPRKTEPSHTIIVTSTEETDSSEEVLEKIRKTVEAGEGEVYVDKIRKAKNQKVVISCSTEENLEKIKKKILANKGLQAEKAKNKDPLVIIRDVLTHNTDEDILAAIKKQNYHLTKDVPEEEYRASIRYRRRARNQQENHVILQVSPKVYQRLVAAGAVYIGLQKRSVKDQSPLIQCTKCLGFGHGKKLCTQTESLCSHCSGPHMRSECPTWTIGEQATCRNCSLAKSEDTNHNAFDYGCPIKRKWDTIARLSVAYC